jgi:uncharacterized membrane protein
MADWGVVARAVHVLAVVLWIGGLSLVTTVLLPGMKRKPPEVWLREFDALEQRFAPQARIAALLALLSGLYILYQYDLWYRFAEARFWWMDLMVGVWLLFAALLFVIEPFVVHRARARLAASSPETALLRMIALHRVMLALSLLAIFAAICGSHGFF